jgi:aryl-alcohol dehydrogenase-like predicted oxidoreductase
MLTRMLEPTRPLVDALVEISKKYDATPGQVALNWVVHNQGENVVAIPGATKAEHARESADAMKFKLTEGELARLGELSKEYK